MIIYFDSSVLVKTIIEEPGSPETKFFISETAKFDDIIFATSIITNAEVMCALAAMRRGKELGKKQFQDAVEEFKSKWKSFYLPKTTENLITQSGELGLNHKLKGCDAFHLASAIDIKANWFVCSDKDLNKAAYDNKLSVWNPMEDSMSDIMNNIKHNTKTK